MQTRQITEPGRLESIALVLVMTLLVYGLGYRVEQSDFGVMLGLYSGLFACYLWIWSRAAGASSVRFFLGLGIWLRVVLLFSVPNLSDDVYRFIWDGRLILNGVNPFLHLPSWFMESGNGIDGLTNDLYAQLNSPGYFTIYPPVAQATFALAVWIFPGSIWGSSLVMKLVLLGCELGTLWLLPRLLAAFGMPSSRVLGYALNPLIIMEISGNLHFEGAMIFFLLLSLWWLVKGREGFSAAAMAFSVAAKLLPLMFWPLLIRRLGWGRSLRYFLLAGMVLVLLFLPLLGPSFWEGFGSSLQLYFRRFEFNASVYYVLRWIGFQWVGYNLIGYLGPALGLCVFGGILLLAVRERHPVWQTFPERMLWAVCLYLLLATTVHPWYVSLPVVYCLFTGYRFPIVWSGLIMLTYINYSYVPYRENLWVVGLEYGVVICFAWWEGGKALLSRPGWKKRQEKRGHKSPSLGD